MLDLVIMRYCGGLPPPVNDVVAKYRMQARAERSVEQVRSMSWYRHVRIQFLSFQFDVLSLLWLLDPSFPCPFKKGSAASGGGYQTDGTSQ